MNIDYLIKLLENKSIVLNDAKVTAFSSGDLERITALEREINETQNTLYRLRLLQTTEQAAALANTSIQTMMVAGVEAVQNTINNPDAKLSLGEYDITSYATDPLHEQKVETILSSIAVMTAPEMVDAYIQSVAAGSPVTGTMVLQSAKKYSIDARLLLAMMQQDSSLGTAGVGASTYNPGNVGNTGTETRIFASWEEGVDAVAAWLSTHRAVKPVDAEPTETMTPDTSTEATETISSSTPEAEPIISTDSATTTATDTPQ